MSATRFHQVPVGGRFRYEDKTYRKHSALVSTDEADGSQRVIPRSALVELIEAQTAPPAPAQEMVVPITAVLAAFEGYRLACEQGVEATVAAGAPDAARTDLEEARKRFLAAIEAAAQAR